MKLERKRAVKTTQEQYKIYVDFLNQHDVMKMGRLSPSMDSKEVEQKWEELAQLLNSCANGPQKDVKSWKSVFAEWKSVIKRKARILLGEEKKSDGAPAVKPLTDLECRLLAAIGEVMVFDIDTIPEVAVLPAQTSEAETHTLPENQPVVTSESQEPTVSSHSSAPDAADSRTRLCKRNKRQAPYPSSLIEAFKDNQAATTKALKELNENVKGIRKSLAKIARIEVLKMKLEIAKAKANGICISDL